MHKPCVLVFAGSDPSGGAGIAADIQAIAAQGAHALPVITAIPALVITAGALCLE